MLDKVEEEKRYLKSSKLVYKWICLGLLLVFIFDLKEELIYWKCFVFLIKGSRV